MPIIKVSFSEELADYFEDILTELNESRTGDKHVDISSFFRDKLRDFVVQSWKNYLTWKETGVVGQLDLKDVKAAEVAAGLEHVVPGEKQFTLSVGELMVKRLQVIVPWEQGILKKLNPKTQDYANLGHRVKALLLTLIIEEAGKVDEKQMRDEDRILVAGKKEKERACGGEDGN